MCRLIFAFGSFAVTDIVSAAIAMSCGESANHDNATRVHADGWGAVWRDARNGTLRWHRDARSARDTMAGSPLASASTDMLAIHVRNATLPENRGIQFNHPLVRDGEDWHFMHNGYMPAVYRKLGMSISVFDTAEYFDYLVPRGTERLDPAQILQRLRAVPTDGCSSGNAIAVHPYEAHVIHWSPAECATPVFFQLHHLCLPGAEVVASEIVPQLAPATQWRPVPAGTVLTFPLATGGERLMTTS
jgi:hypothetical protein